jgi:phenylacetate-CoA ligase
MNKKFENIYFKAPLLIQNLGISFYGVFWKYKRFGGCFQSEFKAAKDREFFTTEQWNDYQTDKLRKLLVHAFDTVSFYREKYSNCGVTRDFLKNISLDKLKLLPCTTKEEFRCFGDSKMLSSKLSKGEFYSSSGSTGTPVKIYMPNYTSQTFSALMEARVRNWAGVSYKMSRGMVGGRRIIPESVLLKPFYRYNICGKQTYFSAYHISPNTIENYLEGMIKNKVEWMTGYAMSNFFIADYIQKNGLNAPKLTAVITSSEKLTDDMRKVISETYRCDVFDSYSGAEACGLISETSVHELLVSPDAGIMEFLDNAGNSVSNGQIGEIVSTGLNNFDQPLIRYRIGDMAKLSLNQKTISQHNMQKVDEIIGRVEDIVVGSDGRKMVRFHSLFIDISGLIKSQIIQKTHTDFTIKLLVDDDYNKTSEQIIKAKLESQLGSCNVLFDYPSSLPVEKNGKVKAVISLMS